MNNESNSAGESGSIASSIDLVSNAVIISGVDISQAGYLMQPHKYPDRFMPPLLHEASHWETFNTPVGNSLAYVFLRAWQRSVASENDHTLSYSTELDSRADNDYEAVLDYCRYTSVSEFLRPITEGIALFTEFDLVPGSSEVTTTPTLLAGMLFGGWESGEVGKKTVGDLSKLNLYTARCHPVYRARKENVLCQPFTVENGGYFPGYFLVKAIRNYLVVRRGFVELIDGDLFVALVNAVLFGDLELARLIIDPELDAMFSNSPEIARKDAVNAPLLRIQELFEFLIHDVDRKFIANLEKYIGGKSKWNWLSIQTTNDRSRILDNISVISKNFEWAEDFEGRRRKFDSNYHEIKRLLSYSIKHFLPRLLTDKVNKYYNFPRYDTEQTCLDILYNRRLLCLASFNTFIRIDAGGTCHLGQMTIEDKIFPYITTSALPGFKSKEGYGTYELYLPRQFDNEAICFSVVLDNQCVACGSMNPGKAFDQSEFALRKPALATAAKLRDEMTSKLEKLCADDPIWNHYNEQINRVTIEFYKNHSKHMYDQVHGGNLDLLDDRSVFEVLGRDVQFISDYVAISLSVPNITSVSVIELACKQMNIDFAIFIEKLNLLKNRKFPLHESRGELFYFLV